MDGWQQFDWARAGLGRDRPLTVSVVKHDSGHASGPALTAWGAAVSGPILEVSSTARLPHKSVAGAALIYSGGSPMQEKLLHK